MTHPIANQLPSTWQRASGKLLCWATVLLWLCTEALASDWHTHATQDGIQIATRTVADSRVKEVRASMTLEYPLATIVAVLEDPDLNPRWVPNSAGAVLLERSQAGVSLVHFRLRARWPFQARDAIARFEKQHTDNGNITIVFSNTAEQRPALADHLRLRTYRGFWKLSTTAQGTQVVYQSLVDPGGQIPAWLVNRVAVDTTRQALLNLRQLLADLATLADQG